MCKELIQKAAKSVKGVHSAEWDEKTKILELSYSENVDIQDIHKAIANVGYDTEEVIAKDEAYNKLHKCCQYERAEQK